MVQGDTTLPSPSVHCLFIGENTKERLSRPLTLSLLLTFYYLQGTWWLYSAAITTGIKHATSTIFVITRRHIPQLTLICSITHSLILSHQLLKMNLHKSIISVRGVIIFPSRSFMGDNCCFLKETRECIKTVMRTFIVIIIFVC